MKINFDCKDSVVATVTQEADLSYLEAESTSADELKFDVLEFRLDNLNEQSSPRIFDLQKKWQSSHQILSTARHPAEGGHGELNEKQRIDWLEASLSTSDLIDIEIQSLISSDVQQLVAKARKQSVISVASFHNFEYFPGRELLTEQVTKAFELSADVAKLAVVIETHQQLNDLVNLVEATVAEGRSISAMGMGPLGKLSRIVLANAGSCLNYGYLKQANAPGQWPANELRYLVDECR